MKVPEETLIHACVAGDVTRLRQWARLGVRVVSAMPLCQAAVWNNLDVCRCLVKELDADVNRALESGYTPVCIAAEESNVIMIECLVRELGADVNQCRGV
jgi:hypothetical protein